MTAREVARLPREALHDLVRRGNAIDPRALDDTEYRGVSLGLPALVERLTWKTFQKTFHRDPATGLLRGWNVKVEQRGVDAPSVPKRGRDGRPLTFGHYVVVDGAEGRGLLIDYSQGARGPLDPLRLVRDPIVAVNEGDPSLLLGWTYLAIGPFSPGTPSYFTLEREGPLSHIA